MIIDYCNYYKFLIDFSLQDPLPLAPNEEAEVIIVTFLVVIVIVFGYF